MRRPARREDRMASPRAMAARAAARWRPSACQHRGRWVGHLAARACVFARAPMQRRAAAVWAKVARLRGIRFCARAVRLLGNAEDCGARICCRLGFGRGTRLLVAPRAVGGIEPGASSADGRAIAEARQLHELRRLALILFGRGAKARRGLRVAVKARSKEERVGRIGLLRDRLPGREQQRRHDACAQ